ncbi:MAG: hypothetical protein IKI37_05365, partial [Oscillospiraceae bacterium]|nr:hypothetical protein [Oscillospiraceae bacterium]
ILRTNLHCSWLIGRASKSLHDNIGVPQKKNKIVHPSEMLLSQAHKSFTAASIALGGAAFPNCHRCRQKWLTNR